MPDPEKLLAMAVDALDPPCLIQGIWLSCIHDSLVASGTIDPDVRSLQCKAGGVVVKCARCPCRELMTTTAVGNTISFELIPMHILMTPGTILIQSRKQLLLQSCGGRLWLMASRAAGLRMSTFQLKAGQVVVKGDLRPR